MEQSTAKLDWQSNIGKALEPFFFGRAFPVLVGLIVALGYVIDFALLSLAFLSIFAAFVFLFYKNVSPIIPMLFMVVLAFRDYSIMNNPLSYVALIPAISAFVARFFIHPIKWTKPGKLFFPLIIITIAYCLGGILRDDYSFSTGIAYTVSLGPVMLVIYCFFYYNVQPKKNFCVKQYLCFSLIVCGLVMIFQMLFVRYVLKQFKFWELLWGNINSAAAFLLLAIPACYYLIIKSKAIIRYLIILICLYLGILLSRSDATLVVALAYSPFLLFYTYRNVYRTKRIIFSYSVAAVIIIIASLIIALVSIYGIEGTLLVLHISTYGSGRNEIYKRAVKLFCENPLFGYGFGFIESGTLPNAISSIRLFNFHSTLFHVMATMGIFGLIAYAFYFVMRFAILMKNNSPFCTTMLVAFIMFESYAMVDTGEFNAIPLMSAVTVIITIVELTTKKGNANRALPLSTNRSKGYNF